MIETTAKLFKKVMHGNELTIPIIRKMVLNKN